MATLTILGEPFPDGEADFHAAASRELAEAVAECAPRGCSSRLLLAKTEDPPRLVSPRARVETLPFPSSVLPLLWQSSATARALDGEFVHAPTPMVPLRSRGSDDGSQTSVMIPHGLAWEAPELMAAAAARLYRSFARRAVRLADVVLAPSHATARVLQRHYGDQVPIQVLPLAAPAAARASHDSAERRVALGVPERYVVTTAGPGVHGRLDWVIDALRAEPGFVLVVITGRAAPTASRGKGAIDGEDGAIAALIPEELRDRVQVVRPRELADIGAVISGAALFALPQTGIGTGYEVLGALASGVPVLHAGTGACAELVLEGGRAGEDPASFARELHGLLGSPDELARLRVLAEDRSRAFSWDSTAWQLWELHANL